MMDDTEFAALLGATLLVLSGLIVMPHLRGAGVFLLGVGIGVVVVTAAVASWPRWRNPSKKRDRR